MFCCMPVVHVESQHPTQVNMRSVKAALAARNRAARAAINNRLAAMWIPRARIHYLSTDISSKMLLTRTCEHHFGVYAVVTFSTVTC